MKRYTVIKKFINFLHDNDVAIFSGQEMCKEAYQYDRPGNFYIDEPFGITMSFSLGVAMSTDKRVFIFIGEGDLLRDRSAVAQIAVSNCKNIYLVVLDNGIYQSAGGQPTIFNSIVSKKGFFYNLGFLVQDYTKHFYNRKFKQLQNIMNNLVGPVCIFMEVSKGIKKDLKNIKISKVDMKDRLVEFIKNKELATSLFEPPNSEIVLNLDEISSGGNE